MKISNLIEDDKGKLVVYRWPDSDEYEIGRITRWDEHSVYIAFIKDGVASDERACTPKYIRLLQGQP